LFSSQADHATVDANSSDRNETVDAKNSRFIGNSLFRVCVRPGDLMLNSIGNLQLQGSAQGWQARPNRSDNPF
jgi:hypothetical protein